MAKNPSTFKAEAGKLYNPEPHLRTTTKQILRKCDVELLIP